MENYNTTQERKKRRGDINITPIDLWTLVFFVYNMLPITPYVLPQKIRYLFMIAIVLQTLRIVGKSNIAQIPLSLMAAQAILFICLWIGKYSHVRDSSLINSLSRYLMFWCPMYVSFAIGGSENDYSETMLYLLRIGYLFTMVTTIIGNLRYPEVSRLLAGAATEYQLDLYGRLNIGGYGFIYSIAVCMPVLIYNAFIKTSKMQAKVLDILLFAAGVAAIVISKYSTAVLLCVIEVAMLLIQKSKDKTTIAQVIAAVAVLLLMTRKLIAMLVLSLTEILEKSGNELMANRFYGIYCILAGIETQGDLAKRIKLYTKSLDIFFKSPLLGNLGIGYHSLGGHSELCDLLGGSGIVGFLSFLTLLQSGIKNALSKVAPGAMSVYYTVLAAFIILLAFDSVFTSLGISFALFMMPALFLFEKAEDGDQEYE